MIHGFTDTGRVEAAMAELSQPASARAARQGGYNVGQAEAKRPTHAEQDRRRGAVIKGEGHKSRHVLGHDWAGNSLAGGLNRPDMVTACEHGRSTPAAWLASPPKQGSQATASSPQLPRPAREGLSAEGWRRVRTPRRRPLRRDVKRFDFRGHDDYYRALPRGTGAEGRAGATFHVSKAPVCRNPRPAGPRPESRRPTGT